MTRGLLGTRNLNRVLQELINPPSPHKNEVVRGASIFREGDTPDGTLRERVIQLTNDYKREVFNGDLGIIQSIDTTEQEMVVGIGERLVTYDYADLNEIALAWSISIHKSQGSEYPVVILPLFMQHYSNAESKPTLYRIDQGEEIGNCGWKQESHIHCRSQRRSATLYETARQTC
ncbi:ATP-binding domain-containing protein [Lyngbya sp. PCC 8106]|uniref:ATP-binding domain-containing protein n=1 Tax=Lyngbya sp. (strain PCC 8106) TaxID=313612 RepID=UPI0000EA8F73|nr:exodeoxyribonuclease V, alpha chain [Lyngbya sp. PCC 8106]